MISRMRAATQTRYGGPDVVSVGEIDVPVPGRGQVLVRVTAASLNAADLLAIGGSPLFVRLGSGLFRPRHPIPGTDVAGMIEAVGDDVSEFAPGDRVVGDLSATGRGAFAEFVVTRPDALVKLPDGVDAAGGRRVGSTASSA